MALLYYLPEALKMRTEVGSDLGDGPRGGSGTVSGRSTEGRSMDDGSGGGMGGTSPAAVAGAAALNIPAQLPQMPLSRQSSHSDRSVSSRDHSSMFYDT
jgi:hypothetical protein